MGCWGGGWRGEGWWVGGDGNIFPVLWQGKVKVVCWFIYKNCVLISLQTTTLTPGMSLCNSAAVTERSFRPLNPPSKSVKEK